MMLTFSAARSKAVASRASPWIKSISRYYDLNDRTVQLYGRVLGATIVVTRGLLDALDREETQAIIGHLVASIGNGDLRIVHYILTMYAIVGLLERLPFTPIDPEMRARVRKVVRGARCARQVMLCALCWDGREGSLC